VTLPQVVLVLAAVLPLREFDPQLALDMLIYHQQRNPAAATHVLWNVGYAAIVDPAWIMASATPAAAVPGQSTELMQGRGVWGLRP
jgi:hypothetical protein